MEEIDELKNVLERVEGKLIAAGKMYGAMNFGIWLAAMAVFYTLYGVFDMSGWASALYWAGAIMVVVPLTARIWRRLEGLYSAVYPDAKERGDKKAAFLIGLPWAIGSIVGWGLIPSLEWVGVSTDARLGVGFLSFIAISIFGMWLLMTRGRGEREMMPSFVLPLLAIPVVWRMETGAVVWAGFVVTAGYSFTVLWYLHSAFKAIER
ncbi:hypothetical protein TEU_02715 [Thermococcus eurythermalis]|uniref:Uncharacterized protein n=1 Tax=Thermococcus eurythermalis TaxID=1505907 RepID=A0A097QS90_9EURY|nr:hypothetical protein [Thermococcus eurythermalis]AIU69341.1 hypothetical protein TEU_02715 [Thermococcus eurythermalis]